MKSDTNSVLYNDSDENPTGSVISDTQGSRDFRILRSGKRTSNLEPTQESPRLSEIPKQKSFSSYRTKSSNQKKQAANLSVGDGRFKQTSWFLPAPEKLFLEDMLSDNPRYLSNSQLNPLVYWEEAAAKLPEYRGPWQTAPPLSTTIPKE